MPEGCGMPRVLPRGAGRDSAAGRGGAGAASLSHQSFSPGLASRGRCAPLTRQQRGRAERPAAAPTLRRARAAGPPVSGGLAKGQRVSLAEHPLLPLGLSPRPPAYRAVTCRRSASLGRPAASPETGIAGAAGAPRCPGPPSCPEEESTRRRRRSPAEGRSPPTHRTGRGEKPSAAGGGTAAARSSRPQPRAGAARTKAFGARGGAVSRRLLTDRS